PLPFRALFLICFGIWAWGSNIQLLRWTGIEPSRLLLAPGKKILRHRSIYQLAGAYSAVLAVGWLVFAATQSTLVIVFVYVGFFALTVNPVDSWWRHKRFCFLRSLGRIIFGGLASPVHLADVVLADILTSFARVLADLYVVLCYVVTASSLDLAIHSLEQSTTCVYSWVGPVLVALPYMLRLKQCLIEAAQSRDWPSRRRHLANALKYASAFPVIILSAVQRLRSSDSIRAWENMFVCVLFNSFYSFYWDVAVDWQLGPLSLPLTPQWEVHARYLRPMLHFSEPSIYYLAIVLDFLLRFTWSLKLSTHLRLDELTAGGFVLEWLEVVRRWLWVYFRLEREWV
ncbi:EXS family-domain-containing protein, partial [Thamnocephalis sphaerospora]